MNCNVCKCKTCKYNNGCEYPAYYNCGHYVPNKERTMSRYIDYDKLDDNILALNEKGWEITRGEYKRIQSVMFEMIELEIPDNPTNGEVIKALFPKAKIYESSKYHNILFAPSCHLDCRNEDWWNAPYKLSELKGE